jgi:hypothetical protein
MSENDNDKKSATWAFTIDKENLNIDQKKTHQEEQLKKKSILKEKKLRLDFKSVPKQASRTQMAKEEEIAIEKEMEEDKFFNRVIKPKIIPALIFIGALVAIIIYKNLSNF